MNGKRNTHEKRKGHPLATGMLVGFAAAISLIVVSLLVWPELVNAIRDMKSLFLRAKT